MPARAAGRARRHRADRPRSSPSTTSPGTLPARCPTCSISSITTAATAGAFWVARLDGRGCRVGRCGAAPRRPRRAASPLSRCARCAVAGVGRALVDAVVDWCRAAGVARLTLWSDTRFDRAHRLYEGMGFKKTGERELPDDPTTLASSGTSAPVLGRGRPARGRDVTPEAALAGPGLRSCDGGWCLRQRDRLSDHPRDGWAPDASRRGHLLRLRACPWPSRRASSPSAFLAVVFGTGPGDRGALGCLRRLARRRGRGRAAGRASCGDFR